MARSKAEISPGSGSQGKEASSDDPASGDLCQACGTPLVVIRLNIDGNALLMQSCETCDIRSWRLDGETIDRTMAIAEVEDHTGRRR